MDAWVLFDIETTGLKVLEGHRILELYAQEVDPVTLQRGKCFHRVVAHKNLPVMDPKVQKMHEDSALLRDIAYAVDRIKEAKRTQELFDLDAWGIARDEQHLSTELLAWFKMLRADPGRILLVGNSVHFDREFLTILCPGAVAWLHHRHVDVSVVRTMYSAWVQKLDRGAVAHRAMTDCQMSWEGLAWARTLIEAGAHLPPPAAFAVAIDEQKHL